MRGNKAFNAAAPKRATGVALIISLVLLMVLTIAGVSAVQTTSLELRMARNDNDGLLAFQAAESALRDAEDEIEALTDTTSFTGAGSGGRWTIAPLGDPERWQAPGVWTGGGSKEADTEIATVAEQPRYIIEHAATVIREANAYQLDDPYASGGNDQVEIFRATARGVGGNPNTDVLLQTTYGRTLD